MKISTTHQNTRGRYYNISRSLSPYSASIIEYGKLCGQLEVSGKRECSLFSLGSRVRWPLTVDWRPYRVCERERRQPLPKYGAASTLKRPRELFLKTTSSFFNNSSLSLLSLLRLWERLRKQITSTSFVNRELTKWKKNLLVLHMHQVYHGQRYTSGFL